MSQEMKAKNARSNFKKPPLPKQGRPGFVLLTACLLALLSLAWHECSISLCVPLNERDMLLLLLGGSVKPPKSNSGQAWKTDLLLYKDVQRAVFLSATRWTSGIFWSREEQQSLVGSDVVSSHSLHAMPFVVMLGVVKAFDDLQDRSNKHYL